MEGSTPTRSLQKGDEEYPPLPTDPPPSLQSHAQQQDATYGVQQTDYSYSESYYWANSQYYPPISQPFGNSAIPPSAYTLPYTSYTHTLPRAPPSVEIRPYKRRRTEEEDTSTYF